MGFINKTEPEKNKNWLGNKRSIEFRLLLLVSFCLIVGLWLVYQAKSQRPLNFNEVNVTDSQSKQGQFLNLSQVKDKEELTPYLTNIPETSRFCVAESVIYKLSLPQSIENVGKLGTKFKLLNEEDLKKLGNEKKQKEQNFVNCYKDDKEKGFAILIPTIGKIKSSFVVRTPNEFLISLLQFSGLFILGFWGLHFYWRYRGIETDQIILPNILALCCFGFLMMISLQDPLRDTLRFTDFVEGVIAGIIAIGIITSLDFQQIYRILKPKIPKLKIRKWTFSFDNFIQWFPFGISILLSLALYWFGDSPGNTDVRVNLWFFQPSELIKILVCLFLASYFAQKYELIENLSEKNQIFSKIPIIKQIISFAPIRSLLLNPKIKHLIPRLKDILPLSIGMIIIITFFIIQKDLGPALLVSGLFLILFAIVRKQFVWSITGFLVIVGTVFVNYKVFLNNQDLALSKTAGHRVELWLNPWMTDKSTQIADSLWALATGGLSGTGLGLGNPNFIPQAYNDLILSALGEEFGFLGLLIIFSLYFLLFYRCFRIASSQSSPYSFFLVISIAIVNVLQILFISAAMLNLVPLSGIVTPFLSDGKTSMIINFAAFAIILVVSKQPGESWVNKQGTLNKWTNYILAGLLFLGGLVIINAAWTQLWSRKEIFDKPVGIDLNKNGDIEPKYSYQGQNERYIANPRIAKFLRELPHGTIYDRNGIPLASNDWNELETYREKFKEKDLEIDLENVCQKGIRCYPFGSDTYFLLGNTNSKLNWSGRNDFIERKKEFTLHGLKNQEELIDRILSGYPPTSYSIDSQNNIKTTIDIRLQRKLTELIREKLEPLKLKGAIVVLDPKSGDLLASVSFPLPLDKNAKMDSKQENITYLNEERLLDRARTGKKAPGSTFKIVTEIAALQLDSNADAKPFDCKELKGTKRVGNELIRDATGDPAHGNPQFERALTVSCNAYFAKLGTEFIKEQNIMNVAKLFEINVGKEIKDIFPQTYVGQGQVQANPLLMARVASTIANGGTMPYGHWIIGENNDRNNPPQYIISQEQSDKIAKAMFQVVSNSDPDSKGTAYDTFNKYGPNLLKFVAGKTGTAENAEHRKDGNGKFILDEKGNKKWFPLIPHSWFMGFAPYNNENQPKIAFATFVENGGKGSGIATEISIQLIKEAQRLGLIK